MKRYVLSSTARYSRQPLLLILLCLSFLVTSCGQPDEAVRLVPTTSTQAGTRPASGATPTLTDAQHDALLQADEEQWARDWATVEAGGSLPTPTPELTPVILPTAAPLPIPMLGIHQECSYANGVFDYGGCWVGRLEGAYVFVESGAFWSDPERGALRVYTSTLDLQEQGMESVYRSPVTAGKLRIVDVLAPRVLVQADDGAQGVFNLTTRQWEGAPLPTTPTPATAACAEYRVAFHHNTSSRGLRSGCLGSKIV